MGEGAFAKAESRPAVILASALRAQENPLEIEHCDQRRLRFASKVIIAVVAFLCGLEVIVTERCRDYMRHFFEGRARSGRAVTKAACPGMSLRTDERAPISAWR